jgi:methionyl-tRNA formyltransferase
MEQNKEQLKIVFMGTPDFGAIVLEELIKNNLKPILVITEPDKPVGRKQILTPPPVKLIAQKYNIPITQPEKIKDWEIKNLIPDIIIVAAYGQIIPKEILDLPKFGCLNVHPSLLPKYRGASPIQTAILNGDSETGVTIMLMDEKMDHGPILAKQEQIILNKKIDYKELHDNLAIIGSKLLVEVIPDWIDGRIKAIPQDETKAIYIKLIKKEDGKINWNNSAEEIERKIRAFSIWPGSFTFYNKNDKKLSLKIIGADASRAKSNKQIGEIFLTNENELAINTGNGCLIVKKLQLEGKKPMLSEEFLLGNKDILGSILQ